MSGNNIIESLIRDYMVRGGKKLTIPALGAFMRRSDDEIIFVDLVRRDDGVLRAMVEDEGHYGEVEAMALVDRFVFEVRHSAEQGRATTIEGFGALVPDGKGSFTFQPSPSFPAGDGTIRESLFGGEGAVQESLFDHLPEQASGQMAESPTQPGVETATQPGAKTTPGQSSEPATVRQNAPTPNRPRVAPRRGDIFIIIAIVAAVVALLAMVFGLSRGNMPFLNR